MKRTVTDVRGGVRAETVSADPQTAALLKAHVREMYARLDQNRAFPYPMSRSVSGLFKNAARYHRHLEDLPNGVAVIETSADLKIVALLRTHAREIDGFVREGLPAMMRGMI